MKNLEEITLNLSDKEIEKYKYILQVLVDNSKNPTKVVKLESKVEESIEDYHLRWLENADKTVMLFDNEVKKHSFKEFVKRKESNILKHLLPA